jgi:SAM-dependent methyltransferase
VTDFNFKEHDEAGMSTLEVMAEAYQLNKWMYNTIKPYCTGNILEIGSGIGNLSDFFIKDKYSITLSDIRKNYCELLREKFSENNCCKGVIELDISDPLISAKDYPYNGKFDTVFSLNVVEHIKDDSGAVKNCFSLLKPGGTLIILVPAGKKLYNSFDRELEHYKRYSRKELINLVESNNFCVKKIQYFNFVGMFGWFIFGNILKRKLIPKNQTKIFNFLTPIFKLFDAIVFRKAGLSLIIFATKLSK